jgi:methyl-accepting chemotaxis protein PixJ
MVDMLRQNKIENQDRELCLPTTNSSSAISILPLSTAEQTPTDTVRPTIKQEGTPLRRQLFTTILPAVLVPLAIAGISSWGITNKRASDRAELQLRNDALLVTEATQKQMNNALNIISGIAVNPTTIEAARNGAKEAAKNRLSSLSLEELENRFSATKLLQLQPILNDYLLRTKQLGQLEEVFFTEKTGFNVAYSNITSDFVQSDEQWWQSAKNSGSTNSFIGTVKFDESASSFSVELLSPITELTSGEFLGVIKGVVSAANFGESLAKSLESAGFDVNSSKTLQLVDIGSKQIISTVTAQGVSDTQQLLGSDAVWQKAAGLIAELQAKGIDPKSPPLGTEVSTLTATFTDSGRFYALAQVPGTKWMAITSIDLAEVRAPSNELAVIFSLIFLALAGVAAMVVQLLSRRLSAPISNLTATAEQVAAGNLDLQAEPSGTSETQTMAQSFNNLVSQVRKFLQGQAAATAQAQLFAEVTGSRITDGQDTNAAFNQALAGARELLKLDRMVVYRFNPNRSGYISAESVADGWPIALNDRIEDPCIPDRLLEAYQNGRVVPTNDVLQAGFHPEHQKLMERLQVKANLVVPILNQGQLFGLLVAHHCGRTYEWQESEINFMQQLAAQMGLLLDRLTFLQGRDAEAKRSQLLKDITLQMTQGLTVQDIFDTTVRELRQAIQSDRAIVYRFDENWQGTIVAESVASGWPAALGAQIADPCFADRYVEKYRQGRVQAVADISEAGLTECHLNQLKPFAVQANLVAPILVNGNLLGLLIAHQCAAPRQWEQAETDFLAQVATQVGLAIERSNLLEKQRQSEAKQRREKELLQQRALELLMEIDPVSKGDLTVRAKVTEDEIGTVADSYNATIRNLRQIVEQVQSATQSVAKTTADSEPKVKSMAAEAVRQVEAIAAALEQIETMAKSSQGVANRAKTATEQVQIADRVLKAGDNAMNRTVSSISLMQSTVSDATKKVKQLGESSQKISKVVKLIRNIAAQTNMLALNASIEAARAGEEGQGFAVVAEQVRTLAQRSALATTEIGQIIEEIQAQTSEVVATMETGTEQVNTGSRQVEEARQQLAQVSEVSDRVNKLVQEIARAASTQTHLSTQVGQTIKDVAAIASNTQTQSGSVADSFSSLLEVAQELQVSVAQFKVS